MLLLKVHWLCELVVEVLRTTEDGKGTDLSKSADFCFEERGHCFAMIIKILIYKQVEAIKSVTVFPSDKNEEDHRFAKNLFERMGNNHD